MFNLTITYYVKYVNDTVNLIHIELYNTGVGGLYPAGVFSQTCVFFCWSLGPGLSLGPGPSDDAGGDGGRISGRVQASIPSHPGIKYPVRAPSLTPILSEGDEP